MDKKSKKEENIELFKLVKKGNLKAREKIIQNNLPFVNFIITKKFKNINSQEREDFFETGILGLIKAVDSFKLEIGISFSTYASRCIENEILLLMRYNKKHVGVISLDAPIKNGFNGEFSLLENLPDCKQNIEEKIEDEIQLKSVKSLIKFKLPKNQAEIIEKRYLSGEIKSQLEISKETGFSQPHISRLEKKGIKKLKEELYFVEN